MKTHKEGRKFLSGLFLIILGLLLIGATYLPDIPFWIISIILSGFFLFFLQFFRDPERQVPNEASDSAILMPADGKVVVIEETEETEFLKEKRRQVSIFMSPFNVHANRNPITGKIIYYKYHPGKYLVAWHPKSSSENERNTVVAEHSKYGQLLYRQIAGIAARRIKCYVREGDPVNAGDQYGFIKFGSRLDIFLPMDAKLNVQIGQNVKAGSEILAWFNDSGSAQ